MISPERLADVFVEVADTLVDDFDLMEFLHKLAEHAAWLSGGVVGLVLADEHQQLHYMGASDESARLLELVQLQVAAGPCLDCFRSGEQVSTTDLVGEAARWPAFAPYATGAGFRSVHAFPMRVRARVLGAVNVFRRDGTPLAHDQVRIIQALADVATVALIQEQTLRRAETLTGQLQTALDSRVIIEQAKGAVAGALGVSVEEAFERIRDHSRRERTPLTDFARDLVAGPERIERLR